MDIGKVYDVVSLPSSPQRDFLVRNNGVKVKIESLKDMTARFSMSLKRYLTTPTRDFLIRNDGTKVPVSDLEGKVVAFYFHSFYEGDVSVNDLIALYEELRLRGENFEIVLICSRAHDEDEKSFMEAFKSMPWLAIPYEDKSYLKLMRIFRCYDGELVIVRPGEKCPDTYGMDIISEYGIEAYPFTRERVAEIEVTRLKSLTLESILFSGDCKYIEGHNGQKIKARDLVNKTILLLFTRKSCSDCHQLIPKLITWYNKTKEMVKEDLEIIHIPYDYDPKEICYYGAMPGLQFPYDEKYNQNLYWKTLDIGTLYPPIIVAFGPDGRIVTRRVHCKFLYQDCESKIEYPFNNVNFFKEVKLDMASKMFWPIEDGDENEYGDEDEVEDEDEDGYQYGDVDEDGDEMEIEDCT